MAHKMYWLFLMASILLEVSGTSIMKWSQASWPVTGMLVMYGMLGFSYFFLAKAVIKLPIGVAYAFWEGIGLALITLISVLVLGERLDWPRGLALCMVLCGTLLVHHGTDSGEAHEQSERDEPEGQVHAGRGGAR